MWSTGCVEGWMPTAAMVATNIVIAIMTALLKQALNQGMNRLVLITFRQMLATVFLGPIAYFKERKTRPRITAEIFGYLFLSGILGPVMLQYTLFVGLEYTTATFAATFGNLLPVVTFLISLAFGYEALEVRSKSGSAKISGTLLSLTGAMMLTFYKGASLTHFHQHLPPSPSAGAPEEQHRSAVRWVLGSAAMLANVVGFAAWLLLQRRLTRLYPAVYSATAVMSLLSFVQAAALALSTQWGAGVAAWRLQGTVEVVAVVYCGVVASGVGYLMLTYCVEKRGPVFTAAFSPLAQMFVAGIDLCVLHEPLYLGSVLGSVLVILGLYLVLWGKREEAAAVAAAAAVSPLCYLVLPCTLFFGVGGDRGGVQGRGGAGRGGGLRALRVVPVVGPGGPGRGGHARAGGGGDADGGGARGGHGGADGRAGRGGGGPPARARQARALRRDLRRRRRRAPGRARQHPGARLRARRRADRGRARRRRAVRGRVERRG